MEFKILLLVETNTEKLWGFVPCAVPGVIDEVRETRPVTKENKPLPVAEKGQLNPGVKQWGNLNIIFQ